MSIHEAKRQLRAIAALSTVLRLSAKQLHDLADYLDDDGMVQHEVDWACEDAEASVVVAAMLRALAGVVDALRARKR